VWFPRLSPPSAAAAIEDETLAMFGKLRTPFISALSATSSLESEPVEIPDPLIKLTSIILPETDEPDDTDKSICAPVYLLV